MTARYFVELMPNIRACTVVVETPKCGVHTLVKCSQSSIIIGEVEICVLPHILDVDVAPKVELRKGVAVFRFLMSTGSIQGNQPVGHKQGATINGNVNILDDVHHAVVGSAFPQGSIYRGFATADKIQDLLPGHIQCRKCHSRLSCSVISKVFPLPSEGWTELCDYISCSSDLKHLRNVEARPGTCLVGDTYVLLHEHGIESKRIRNLDNVHSLRPTDADSNVCESSLNSESDHQAHCMQTPPSAGAPVTCSAENDVVTTLTESSMQGSSTTVVMCQRCLWTVGGCSANTDDGHTQYQFFLHAVDIISCDGTAAPRNGVKVWIMNETASVVSGCSWEHQDGTGGSNTIGTSGASIMRPRPVVKVLFSSEYKKDRAVVEVVLEPELIASLHLELAYSNGLLPPFLRSASGMRTGFLRL